MRALLTVAWREVTERRAVFGVAAGLGILSVLALKFNILGIAPSSELNTVVVGAGFTALLVGLSLLVGASIIGRDMAERRMGFYFSRPISDLSIWAGKFLGGLFLVYTSAYLSTVPLSLFESQTRKALFSPEFSLISLGIAVILYSFGLVLGVAFRSKSKWLALDLTLIPIMMLVAFPAIKRLAYTGAEVMFIGPDRPGTAAAKWYDPYGMLIYGVVGVLIIMLTASLPTSIISFMLGRVDIKRMHRALSFSMWSFVFAGLLLFHGYSYWFVSASPKEINEFHQVVAAPKGNWAAISGTVSGRDSHYMPSYLIDTTSDNYYRFEKPIHSVRFSADGKTATWLELESLSEETPVTLVTMRLDSSKVTPVRTNIVLPFNYDMQLFLTEDGSRVGVVRDKLLSVFELPSGKELLTVALPFPAQGVTTFISRAFFMTPDHLRFYRQVFLTQYDANRKNPSRIEIMELDVTTKKLEVTGKIEMDDRGGYISGGDRIIVKTGDSFNIYDARTGEQKATFEDKNGPASVRFLSDGRIAIAELEKTVNVNNPREARLRILSTEGVEKKSIKLGMAKGLQLSGESSPNHLLVALNQNSDYMTYNHAELFLVDLNASTVTPRGTGMLPALSRYYGLVPYSSDYNTNLYYNDKFIARFNPETGETQKLLVGVE